MLGQQKSKTLCHLHVTLLNIQISGENSWATKRQARLDDSPTIAGWGYPLNKIRAVMSKEWGLGTEQAKLGYHTQQPQNPARCLTHNRCSRNTCLMSEQTIEGINKCA